MESGRSALDARAWSQWLKRRESKAAPGTCHARVTPLCTDEATEEDEGADEEGGVVATCAVARHVVSARHSADCMRVAQPSDTARCSYGYQVKTQRTEHQRGGNVESRACWERGDEGKVRDVQARIVKVVHVV
jgi:hypothetical protein